MNESVDMYTKKINATPLLEVGSKPLLVTGMFIQLYSTAVLLPLSYHKWAHYFKEFQTYM